MVMKSDTGDGVYKDMMTILSGENGGGGGDDNEVMFADSVVYISLYTEKKT